MKLSLLKVCALLSVSSAPALLPAQTGSPAAPLLSWVDPNTGHRVTQLTAEKNSKGLYFNQNAFTPDGKKMIYMADSRIHVMDMDDAHATRQLVANQVSNLVVSTTAPVVYFMRPNDSAVYSVNAETPGKPVKVATVPLHAQLSSLNADGTLLTGTYTEVDVPVYKKDPNLKDSAVKAVAMDQRFADRIPMVLFTLNLQNGVIAPILHSTDWLSHVQFSPTDPTLIMYCHEGPSLEVDRIWTIRTDGSHNQLMHKRATPAGIATHEFWSRDGKTIWFDLQRTRGEEFAVAGIDVPTGKIAYEYRLDKALASMHYNISDDGKVFCGDGNLTTHGEIGVHGHRTLDRAWIELLRPYPDGTFHSTRLAHLPDNNYYSTEPNPRFSPDNKLVIFTSNMLGTNYVFAVEVAKAKPDPPAATGSQ